MAALVGCADVPAIGERGGHAVPDVGVAGEAVEKDEGRARGIEGGVAPVEDVEGEGAEGEGVVAVIHCAGSLYAERRQRASGSNDRA